MLNTTNKVTDDSKLMAVADASFVIGISLCQQWDTLKALVGTLIIADKVWDEVVERGETNVFVDDLRGRKVAQSLGLQAVGVAGFLLFPKKKGKIGAIRPLLLQLQKKGFRLSRGLINAVLKEASETL